MCFQSALAGLANGSAVASSAACPACRRTRRLPASPARSFCIDAAIPAASARSARTAAILSMPCARSISSASRAPASRVQTLRWHRRCALAATGLQYPAAALQRMAIAWQAPRCTVRRREKGGTRRRPSPPSPLSRPVLSRGPCVSLPPAAAGGNKRPIARSNSSNQYRRLSRCRKNAPAARLTRPAMSRRSCCVSGFAHVDVTRHPVLFAARGRVVVPMGLNLEAARPQFLDAARRVHDVQVLPQVLRGQTMEQLERFERTVRLCFSVVALMLLIDRLNGLCAKAGGYFFVHSSPLNRLYVRLLRVPR